MEDDHQDYYDRKVARAEEVMPYIAVLVVVYIVVAMIYAVLRITCTALG
tara:strand:- start:400 stop:546 length:147 start_codon:yes stop_codon:yes gene_type:complete